MGLVAGTRAQGRQLDAGFQTDDPAERLTPVAAGGSDQCTFSPSYGAFTSSGGVGFILHLQCHIAEMDEKHPHDGATYTILRLDDGSFGVQVTIPGVRLVTISGLDGEAGAQKWIARHKETVAKGKPGRGFVKRRR